MTKKSNYERQLALIQGKNVNVSEENPLIEFSKLICIIVILVVFILFSGELIMEIIIDNLSAKTQNKIEKVLSCNCTQSNSTKYSNQILILNELKYKMIAFDKKLQDKSSFPIYVLDDKTINAMVTADGTIFFTSGLLEQELQEEELAFVLAHELGHYANRHHLKRISKLVLRTLIDTTLSNESSVSPVVGSVTNLNTLSYSRTHELQADKYASRMLYYLYGNNTGGILFLKRLEKEYGSSEFANYFSTHPSLNKRYKLLKKD